MKTSQKAKEKGKGPRVLANTVKKQERSLNSSGNKSFLNKSTTNRREYLNLSSWNNLQLNPLNSTFFFSHAAAYTSMIFWKFLFLVMLQICKYASCPIVCVDITDLRNNNARLAHSLATQKKHTAELYQRYTECQGILMGQKVCRMCP